MTTKHTFAIGDVHGCYSELIQLLEFSPIKESDQLVLLGDYVDRGPDSARVIQFLVEESERRDIATLKGNHELMMASARHDISSRRSWAMCGGDATWDSYCREYGAGGLDVVPDTHWAFIQSCLPFFETANHVFVHAALCGDLPLDEQPDYMLYWESFNSITPLESGKIVVCGHSSQKDGIPKNIGHAICIDTWACGSGWLTCLNVDTGKYYQVNRSGEKRSDWLEDMHE